MKSFFFGPLFFLSALLIGCTAESRKDRIPSLFDTKEEAEKAAIDFKCTGAHQMGDKWMPCASHEAHEKHNKHSDHAIHDQNQ